MNITKCFVTKHQQLTITFVSLTESALRFDSDRNSGQVDSNFSSLADSSSCHRSVRWQHDFSFIENNTGP